MWAVWFGLVCFLTPPAQWGWLGIASKGTLGGRGAADSGRGQVHHQPGCPGARGTARVQPWHGAEGRPPPAAPATSYGLWLSLIKNSRSPLCRAHRQAAACTSWAAGLSFSVYCVASILASSCSREVLLVETPARSSALPSQPLSLAGSQCSHPAPPSSRARAYP